jgi:hypothetical protein
MIKNAYVYFDVLKKAATIRHSEDPEHLSAHASPSITFSR